MVAEQLASQIWMENNSKGSQNISKPKEKFAT
jgi:hypothetical protein